MKSLLLSLAVICLLACPLCAQAGTFRCSLDTGYRQDDLQWTIAGDNSGQNPNILSDLDWDDVRLAMIGGRLEWIGSVAERGWMTPYAHLALDYGAVFDGEVRDSDYDEDNRQAEFSRSISETDSGYAWDAEVRAGVQMQKKLAWNDYWAWTPYVGFSHNEQSFDIEDGKQVVSDDDRAPPVGTRIRGLDSNYNAQWDGPLLGLKVEYVNRDSLQRERWAVYVDGSYHWLWYDAEADWNLRGDFEHPVSFEHEAEGDGFTVQGGFRYYFRPNWHFGGTALYRDWEADDEGIDQTYFNRVNLGIPSGENNVGTTKFNGAEWTSWAASVSIGLSF